MLPCPPEQQQLNFKAISRTSAKLRPLTYARRRSFEQAVITHPRFKR
jgi:hypothetical protein